MFDQHIICREGFDNVTRDGEIIGVRFLARLPYYRGLGLSMVEDIAVTLNGEAIPRQAIRLALRGREWTLDELRRKGHHHRTQTRRPAGRMASPEGGREAADLLPAVCAGDHL